MEAVYKHFDVCRDMKREINYWITINNQRDLLKRCFPEIHKPKSHSTLYRMDGYDLIRPCYKDLLPFGLAPCDVGWRHTIYTRGWGCCPKDEDSQMCDCYKYE